MTLLRLSLTFLLAGLAAGDALALSVHNSVHDLSAGSTTTGPKAVSEKQTCVFCHASHRPAMNAPLWNRPDSQLVFTFYSSNYLNNYLGQTAPTMAALAGSRTRLCLSCHDGVTALGSLYNIAPNTVQMTGSMRASTIMGANLSDDHPVLYDVKVGAGPPTQPGTDPEIRLPATGDPVKVYGATNRVECTSCHDPHNNQYGKFLVKSNANAALCTTCHQKTNYTSSAHAVSNVAYTPAGGTATTVKEWSCRDCHKVHGASTAQAYILQAAEENTCYQCHGSPPLSGAKNLKTLFVKAYKHPTETVSGIHKNPETDASNLGIGKRHSECWDCHNPHQAQTGTHTAGTASGNLIGKVLLGAWGVEPSYGATAWTYAASYLRQVFTNTTGFKEYQLCFKCHSSYAFGATPPAGYTDQSIEFNPNNRGAHPVRTGLSSQTGSTTPKALTAAQMSAPWTTVGTQTMACSDCHASDATSDPKGPHGSAATRIKKGTNIYWPKNSAGAYYTLGNNNSTDAHLAGLFCRNCHPLRSATANTWYNNAHSEHSGPQLGNVACVACHIVVPHGSRRSRFIGYSSETAPYNAGGTGAYEKLVLSGFKKATGATTYAKANCYSTSSGCTTHSNAGGYDP